MGWCAAQQWCRSSFPVAVVAAPIAGARSGAGGVAAAVAGDSPQCRSRGRRNCGCLGRSRRCWDPVVAVACRRRPHHSRPRGGHFDRPWPPGPPLLLLPPRCPCPVGNRRGCRRRRCGDSRRAFTGTTAAAPAAAISVAVVAATVAGAWSGAASVAAVAGMPTVVSARSLSRRGCRRRTGIPSVAGTGARVRSCRGYRHAVTGMPSVAVVRAAAAVAAAVPPPPFPLLLLLRWPVPGSEPPVLPSAEPGTQRCSGRGRPPLEPSPPPL
jgi:hypothetical protein